MVNISLYYREKEKQTKLLELVDDILASASTVLFVFCPKGGDCDAFDSFFGLSAIRLVNTSGSGCD